MANRYRYRFCDWKQLKEWILGTFIVHDIIILLQGDVRTETREFGEYLDFL